MVELPEEAYDIDVLCDRLDMTGTGVEGVEKSGANFEGVVIGHVLEKEHHPDADTLWVTKIDVGERLALWALAKTYGKKDLVFSGPMYKSMKIEGNRIRLSFDYADGLMTAVKNGYAKPVPAPEMKPSNFAVCDKNGNWFWADAVIEGNEVVVSAKEVAEPTAVRYAYRGCPVDLNMYNGAGLPMVPFRTDVPQMSK